MLLVAGGLSGWMLIFAGGLSGWMLIFAGGLWLDADICRRSLDGCYYLQNPRSLWHGTQQRKVNMFFVC